MKFILEVDLEAGVMADDTLKELGRILRYWAGNLKYYDLASGTASETISDSTYAPVGVWRVEE